MYVEKVRIILSVFHQSLLLSLQRLQFALFDKHFKHLERININM